jgi:hypothetical protein
MPPTRRAKQRADLPARGRYEDGATFSI